MTSTRPFQRLIASKTHLLQPSSAAPSFLATRSTNRHLSSTSSRAAEKDTNRLKTPRWQRTPVGMSMPIRIRPKTKNSEWTCNDDPRKLDAMYVRLLGEGGDKMLSDETKWLAITHKSFDQGKRGFNDRLSYLGKRIVDLQTSIALVAAPKSPTDAHGVDEFGRVPFHHPALDGLSNLSERIKADVLHKRRMASLGQAHGLDRVLRWKPKVAESPLASGVEVVLAQALYSIVGAISLERGGQVANRIAREKILAPLGVIS